MYNTLMERDWIKNPGRQKRTIRDLIKGKRREEPSTWEQVFYGDFAQAAFFLSNENIVNA
jgi:hypothetical protein